MKTALRNEQNRDDNDREICVACGNETEYMFSTPINKRQHYVEGAGQLCPQCYYDIYVKKNG